jgi:sialic acid synthase SpsE
MQIILDISANTHKNDMDYFKEMIRIVKYVDNKKHEIIIKGQIFEKAGDNIPQEKKLWGYMMNFCEEYGYKLTASVFDKPSLNFLLFFNPCFIKIANNRELDWLIGEIPRKIPVYQSLSPKDYWGHTNLRNDHVYLLCVSKYPAKVSDYEYKLWPRAISDHTIGTELVSRYRPDIYECHFCLEDSTGLDAGPWAKRPDELKEILNA